LKIMWLLLLSELHIFSAEINALTDFEFKSIRRVLGQFTNSSFCSY
jgi:hypothetical protein